MNEPAKKIEAGCMAMITGGDFIGEFVSVISFIGTPDWRVVRYHDCWRVTNGVDFYPITESRLMRIDDEDPDKAIESESPVEVEHG